MMDMRKSLSVLLVLALLLSLVTACSEQEMAIGAVTNAANGGQVEGNASPAAVDFSQTDEEMFTDRDRRTEYDASEAVTIKLDSKKSSASSNSVKISGSKVTITEEATYVISGELADGMLVVKAKEDAKIQLVFKGVNITSDTSAALYILEADKVFVTLAEGTENYLINGGKFDKIDDNKIDGALFSKQDLTINGAGTLTVTSPVGHGIVAKDDLVITGGTYLVSSASHGLEANDSVRITNATVNIDAGKDAIHAENDGDASKGFVYISGGKIKAEAEGDGIMAGAYMQIEDGTVDLVVGGGSKNGTKAHSNSFGGFKGGRPGGKPSQNTATASDGTSMKGLKAETGLLVSGGEISIDSADDAIHSKASLVINGGEFSLASGDDAIHAEETLTITGGTIDVTESYEGLEATHVDIQGGNVKLIAKDDGVNAAGGADQSGSTGGRDGMYGGGPGGRGGPGGMSANSNGSIKISGGTVYIKASGDGMDANGTLEISGGHTTLVGPTQGDTAVLDYDKTATITGGTFIGTGSTMMAQTFSDSKQGVIALRVGNQAAGTKIVLQDTEGNTLISYHPEMDFALVILSTPALKKGTTYRLTIGDVTEDCEAN